jgi:glucosyl-dolichyl phosphate glucuronosyltransferase
MEQDGVQIMKDDVSVVIVTYNRAKDVNDAVNSLLNQSAKPLEIIVIDDGSTPPVKLGFRSDRLRLIRFDQEIGISSARNFGVKTAQGDYIAFIDDDAIADYHWLEELRMGFETAQIVGGQVKPLYLVPPPDWWTQEVFGAIAGVGNLSSEGIFGCNMAMKADVFKTVGLFNPDLGRKKGKLLSCEENDFFDRAKRKGVIFKIVRAAVVNHKVPAKRMTLRYILRWSYYNGKSQRIYQEFSPLKTCFQIIQVVVGIVFPRTFLSKKSHRILVMAIIATLIGRLF